MPPERIVEPTKVYVDERDPTINPNVLGRKEVVLKDGQKDRSKVRRIARLTSVRDRHTGEHHHDALSIKTIALSKEACTVDLTRSVQLDGEETNRLADFLAAARSGALPPSTGGYIVMPTRGGPRDVMQALRDLAAPDRLDALTMLLREASEKPDVLGALVSRLARDDGFIEKAAAAMNLAVYREVVDRFEAMIEAPDTSEGDFQALLERHPWLFGSEYSCILDRRRWTRDEIADFVPRRTTDGRVELIEIKTPLKGKALFTFDTSHKVWAPGSDLTRVVAQAENYLEKLDRNRDSILANDGEDVTKMRARIIIGRDLNDDQRSALRRHNGHLHRIEILTFDALLAIARRVLRHFEEAQKV